MKDNRFIELVNLYVDRQISGDEAAELEAEMQMNPRRRAIYRQYCQMHRATTLVYESFRPEAGAETTPVLSEEAKIARFETHPRRRTPWLFYSAGVAAAGAALFFSVSHSSPHRQAMNTAAVATPAVVPTVATAPVEVKTIAATPTDSSRNLPALVATLQRQTSPAFEKGTIQGAGSSLFDDGVFDAQATSAIRGFRNKPSTTQQSEFAAFQFQR